MDLTVVSYVIYLAISSGLTYWAARTLNRAGRDFLTEVLGETGRLPEAVNQLLVVGYYLVDYGFVCLYLRTGATVTDARELFEGLSRKLGIVMVVLGVMHLGNVVILHRIRNSHRIETAQQTAAPIQATKP